MSKSAFETRIHSLSSRSVAQSGSALAWGARGRRFESFHSDQKKIQGLNLFFRLSPFCFCKGLNLQLEMFDREVEVDESYFGGRYKGMTLLESRRIWVFEAK